MTEVQSRSERRRLNKGVTNIIAMTDKATRKSWMYSAAAHALVAAVSLLSFFRQALSSATPMDSVSVEIISADQLPSVTKGIKTGDEGRAEADCREGRRGQAD